MAARFRTVWASWLIVLLLVSGCAVFRGETVQRIALLAPFEGRYREIGYDALYAAQLALAESGITTIDLLPIDDGGSVASATARAQALASDNSVKLVLLMGVAATQPEVQAALDSTPALIVGHWGAKPSNPAIVSLTSPELDALLTPLDDMSVTSIAAFTPAQGQPLIGGELLALHQFPKLRTDLSAIEVLSSSTLPDEDFRARYLSMNQFAPEPGLLATLTYDATQLALLSVQNQTPLTSISYTGINGTVRFADGYWQGAPLHRYHYQDGQLVPIS